MSTRVPLHHPTPHRPALRGQSCRPGTRTLPCRGESGTFAVVAPGGPREAPVATQVHSGEEHRGLQSAAPSPQRHRPDPRSTPRPHAARPTSARSLNHRFLPPWIRFPFAFREDRRSGIERLRTPRDPARPVPRVPRTSAAYRAPVPAPPFRLGRAPCRPPATPPRPGFPAAGGQAGGPAVPGADGLSGTNPTQSRPSGGLPCPPGHCPTLAESRGHVLAVLSLSLGSAGVPRAAQWGLATVSHHTCGHSAEWGVIRTPISPHLPLLPPARLPGTAPQSPASTPTFSSIES